MSLNQWATLIVATIGVLFMLVSALGILRLPDVYTRMHAAGKSATLGISCVLFSVGLFYGWDIMLRMIALVVLFFITNPIAVTTMARAAYRSRNGADSILRYDEMPTTDSYQPGKLHP